MWENTWNFKNMFKHYLLILWIAIFFKIRMSTSRTDYISIIVLILVICGSLISQTIKCNAQITGDLIIS